MLEACSTEMTMPHTTGPRNVPRGPPPAFTRGASPVRAVYDSGRWTGPPSKKASGSELVGREAVPSRTRCAAGVVPLLHLGVVQWPPCLPSASSPPSECNARPVAGRALRAR
ncbi:hypothetical protein MTO96_000251 [Rhipicephalus appendiculatus]